MRLLSRKAAPAMAAGEKQADLVEVFKAARRFHLKRDGDGRTPEGTCTIDVYNPQSSFHLLPRVSHPDADDKAHTSKIGVRRADLYYHGQLNGWRKWFARHPTKDGTSGCVAVADVEMREIRALVSMGARAMIHP